MATVKKKGLKNQDPRVKELATVIAVRKALMAVGKKHGISELQCITHERVRDFIWDLTD